MPSSRRRFLARSGGALLAVGLAGCADRFPGSGPETVDGDRLAAVAQREAPTTPERLPVEIEPAFVADQTALANEYLEEVPAPFDEETIPNEVVRERLNRQYEVARGVVDSVANESTPLERLSRAGYARADAREVLASWRAVDEDRTVSAVRAAAPEIRDGIEEFAARFAYEGADPVRATPVLGEVEQSLRAARLWVEPPDRERESGPFAVGEAATRLERARFDVAAGGYLLDQYRDSLPEDGRRDLQSALGRVRGSLTARVRRRAAELPDPDDVESPGRLVDRDVGETAGVWALSTLHHELERDAWSLTAGDDAPPRVATDALEATAAQVRVEAFASLRTRIEEGADLAVETADDVETFRNAAVDAVAAAQETDAADSLVAALLPEFSRPVAWTDRTFESYEGAVPVPSVQRDAADYLVVAECCRAVPSVARSVGSMLRGE